MTLEIAWSAEAAAARDARRPMVALESTIITHGMPWPRNRDTARAVETAVRDAGAVPVTMAVIDGRLHAGLERDQLDALAEAPDVMKLSRADMAVAIATGRTGATTVAATMIAARHAGIAVFATGGIGGVHRGAETSFDVSADLTELARTPVTVVCSGAKAILDLRKTLEVLETQGVPVIGYRTDRLPAFWSRDAGLPVPLRLDDPAAIAAAHHARTALGLAGGQIVVNPIPTEAEIPRETIAPIVDQALEEAARAGIGGKEVTPYLLARIFEHTEGASLDANIALVIANARLGAEIARAVAT